MTKSQREEDRPSDDPNSIADACANFIMAGLGNIANGQRPPVDWPTYVANECDALRQGAWRQHVDDDVRSDANASHAWRRIVGSIAGDTGTLTCTACAVTIPDPAFACVDEADLLRNRGLPIMCPRSADGCTCGENYMTQAESCAWCVAQEHRSAEAPTREPVHVWPGMVVRSTSLHDKGKRYVVRHTNAVIFEPVDAHPRGADVDAMSAGSFVLNFEAENGDPLEEGRPRRESDRTCASCEHWKATAEAERDGHADARKKLLEAIRESDPLRKALEEILRTSIDGEADLPEPDARHVVHRIIYDEAMAAIRERDALREENAKLRAFVDGVKGRVPVARMRPDYSGLECIGCGAGPGVKCSSDCWVYAVHVAADALESPSSGPATSHDAKEKG